MCNIYIFRKRNPGNKRPVVYFLSLLPWWNDCLWNTNERDNSCSLWDRGCVLDCNFLSVQSLCITYCIYTSKPHFSMMDLLYLKSFHAEETSREEKTSQFTTCWWVASAPQLEILLSHCFSQGINELMCLGVKILGAVSFNYSDPSERGFCFEEENFCTQHRHTHTRTGKGDCSISHCLASSECLSVSLIYLQLPGVGGCSGLCCQTRGNWVSCRWLGRMRTN